MKFKEYIIIMEEFYNNSKLNERLDFNYEIKSISKSDFKFKWGFVIDGDLYTIDAGMIKKDTWEITFYFGEDGKQTTSLTDKNIPLKVLSGVATSIKNLIEEKNPKNIEANIAGKKKANVFYNLIKNEMKNNKDVGMLKNYTISIKKSISIGNIELYLIKFRRK